MASELTKRLSQQLNREVTTVLRFMVQAASIQGAEHETVREMYLEEMAAELRHAQHLANRIAMLGGALTLEPDLRPPPSDVGRMLAHDASEAVIDEGNYVQLASLADLEDRFALKIQMEEQAADENDHGHAMRRLLGHYGRVDSCG